MVGIEENKALVTEFFARQAALEIDRAFELVADDATWWMPGNLPFSGEYTREQIYEVYKSAETGFAEGPHLSVISVTAEDDRVALETEGHGRLHSGFEYSNTYHYLFRVRDGKIVSCRSHQDIHHVWEMLQEANPL